MANSAACLERKDVWKDWVPKRGEIYFVDLGESLDSEQKGIRPFLILSNDVGNKMGDILVGCPLTSKKRKILKIHVPVDREYGLKTKSYVLTEHIRSISKRRFFSKGNAPMKVGELDSRKLQEVKRAVMFELALE